MKLRLPSEKKMISVIRTWFLVGILGFAFPFSFEIFRALIPLSILLMSGVIILYHGQLDRRMLVATGLVALLGYLVEVAGVKTGLIFGGYSYGRVLGPRVAEVPLIMSLNWVIMVYGGVAIAAAAGLRIIPGSILAALILTLSDVIIERFAILTGMWTWDAGDPPLQNYAGWFISAWVLSMIYYKSVEGKKRKIAMHVYIHQLVLFAVTVAVNRFLWP
jgi:putative membrane protein